MSEEKEEEKEVPKENKKIPLIENKEENKQYKDDNLQIDKGEDTTGENSNLLLSSRQIESIKSVSFVINRNIRWLLFIIFIIINLLMNFDHGTIPAATEQIRLYMALSNSKLGLFGSLVFIGVIIGSLVSMTIINTFNRKYILMICLILCGISLFIFTITKNYTLLCIDRVIIGSFQAFISIYLPLWCDQFGFEKRKTMMMALIQIAPPLGVLVGYFVTTLLNEYLSDMPYIGSIGEYEKWLYSFYIQSFIIWGISICLFFFPDKYFNSKARRVPAEIEETLNIIQRKSSGKKYKNVSFFYEGNENFEDELKKNNSFENVSEKDIYEENEDEENEENDDNTPKEEMKDIKEEKTANDNNDNNEDIKDYENKEINEKEMKNNNQKKDIENKSSGKKSFSKDEELPFLTKLKLIFTEPLFICCVLTLSILFFIVTCVQYWTSDYMLIALGVEDEMKRLYAFSTVCLTSPTCGLLLGGFIVDKIGGYSKKGALIFCLIISFMSLLPGIPLPLVDSPILYALLLWFLLFFGASILPTMTGLAIACLPKSVQGSGNSFVIFFYNLVGYLPAPFVYGFLKDLFDDEKDPQKGSRVAQKATIWVTFSACIIIGISIIFRFKYDKEYSEKMGRDIPHKIESQSCDDNNGNNDNDPDAIRPRESSLKPEVNEKKKTESDEKDNSVKINIKENNDDTNNKN